MPWIKISLFFAPLLVAAASMEYAQAAPGEIFAEIMASPESLAWLSPGHAFLCIAYDLNSGVKEECYGFYPAGGGTTFVGAPGLNDEFKKNPTRFSHVTWSMKKQISAQQRKAFFDLTGRVDAANYHLLSNNCADFVHDVVDAFGWTNVPKQLRPEDYVRELYTANVKRFAWTNGQLARNANRWTELDAGKATFSFIETGHNTNSIIVHDGSRQLDLQLPLRGGMAQWRQNGAWTNWQPVAPQFN